MWRKILKVRNFFEFSWPAFRSLLVCVKKIGRDAHYAGGFMKRFNFPQQQDWYKWALTGSLMASLAVCMSFNPETKYIARNEISASIFRGIASPVPPSLTPSTNATQSLVDPNQANGLGDNDNSPLTTKDTIKVSLDDNNSVIAIGSYIVDSTSNTKSIQWRVVKNPAVDGSDYCIPCFISSVDEGASLPSLDVTNLGNLTKAAAALQLKVAALEKLNGFIQAHPDKGSDNSNASSEVAAAQVPALAPDKYTSHCDPIRADAALDSIESCQDAELANISVKCPEDVDASKGKLNGDYCRHVVQKYYERYVRPLIAMGLKADVSTNDDTAIANHKAALAAIHMILGGDGDLDSPLPSTMINKNAAQDIYAMVRKADVTTIKQEFKAMLSQNAQVCGSYSNPNYKSCLQSEASLSFSNAYKYVTQVMPDSASLNSVSMESGTYSDFQQAYLNPIQQMGSSIGTNPGQQQQGSMNRPGVQPGYMNQPGMQNPGYMNQSGQQQGLPSLGTQQSMNYNGVQQQQPGMQNPGYMNQVGQQQGLPSLGTAQSVNNNGMQQPGMVPGQQNNQPVVNFNQILNQAYDPNGQMQSPGGVGSLQSNRTLPGVNNMTGPNNSQVNQMAASNQALYESLLSDSSTTTYTPNSAFQQQANAQQQNGLPNIGH
jgi:hypothetical protein